MSSTSTTTSASPTSTFSTTTATTWCAAPRHDAVVEALEWSILGGVEATLCRESVGDAWWCLVTPLASTLLIALDIGSVAGRYLCSGCVDLTRRAEGCCSGDLTSDVGRELAARTWCERGAIALRIVLAAQ